MSEGSVTVTPLHCIACMPPCSAQIQEPTPDKPRAPTAGFRRTARHTTDRILRAWHPLPYPECLGHDCEQNLITVESIDIPIGFLSTIATFSACSAHSKLSTSYHPHFAKAPSESQAAPTVANILGGRASGSFLAYSKPTRLVGGSRHISRRSDLVRQETHQQRRQALGQWDQGWQHPATKITKQIGQSQPQQYPNFNGFGQGSTRTIASGASAAAS